MKVTNRGDMILIYFAIAVFLIHVIIKLLNPYLDDYPHLDKMSRMRSKMDNLHVKEGQKSARLQSYRVEDRS